MSWNELSWESYAKVRNEQPGPQDVSPRAVLEILKAVAEHHQASGEIPSAFVAAIQSFNVGAETADEELLTFIRQLRLTAIDQVECYRRRSWLEWLCAANGSTTSAPISRLAGAMCFVLYYRTVKLPSQR